MPPAEIVDRDDVQPARVFRDHPEWGRRDRWFQMPTHLLQELYICSYEIAAPHWDRPAYDRHIARIEAEHPGCVIVTLLPIDHPHYRSKPR